LACAVRARPETIPAPPFPGRLAWINTAPLRMDKQRGRPVLIEFWDFCRVNSLRTLPYLKGWHERYADDGLRVIGVHTGAFPPSRDEDEIRRAVDRLEITYPVVVDTNLEIWDIYGNEGWPARYLWDPRGALFSLHYGEGAYAETELEIQELLGVEREPLAPVRPEDEPDALLAAQTEDQPGAYSGPYEAGAAWAVLGGSGEIRVNDEARRIEHAGCHLLVEHPEHTAAVLELEIGSGVECYATCFTPGRAS
jgi:AhpC/TSA family